MFRLGSHSQNISVYMFANIPPSKNTGNPKHSAPKHPRYRTPTCTTFVQSSIPLLTSGLILLLGYCKQCYEHMHKSVWVDRHFRCSPMPRSRTTASTVTLVNSVRTASLFSRVGQPHFNQYHQNGWQSNSLSSCHVVFEPFIHLHAVNRPQRGTTSQLLNHYLYWANVDWAPTTWQGLLLAQWTK